MGLNGPSEKSRGEVRSIRLLQLVCLFWLAELVAPLSLLLQARPSGWRLVTVLAGAAVFVGCYLWTILDNPLARPIAWESVQEHSARLWLPFGLLVVLGTVMGGVFGPSWLVLFIFAAVGAAFRLPPAHLGWLIGGLVVLYGGIGLAEQEGIIAVAQFALIIGGSGGGVAVVCYSIRTARELRAARAEVARLAVEAERLRFARDLHDLLGRSLSLIALKSELAGQLVPAAPDRAVAEIRDVEQVARTALQEVRDAVAGYRQPTLDGELRAAREILAAAGIGFSHDDAPVALPSTVEAVLAWAVREGVTNVIRHSRARYCSIRLQVSGAEAELTISDDGRGNRAIPPSTSPANGRGSGHGLAGLAERVAALGGALRAGPQAGGGFRLTVALPLAAEAGAEPTLLAATPQYESQRP
jgi:two-component system sensor histidine kinase DesK